ncbi:unnamed protein product [Lepidochelys kempii]
MDCQEKRNEEKVCLEKMLQELQLEKKSFRHDFKVSPRDMENKGTLQNQIHSTMECLPELEARVQNLRQPESEASNARKQREKNQDDVQTHFILQQIKVRDHHRERNVETHTGGTC